MTPKFSLLLAFLWFGAAMAQCGSGSANLAITIQYDGSPGQTTVELTNTQSDVVTVLPIAQVANAQISFSQCVATSTLFKVAVKDSAGNGIGGSGYAAVSINNRLIATVSDFGSEVAYYFSAGGQECGNPRWVLDVKYDTNPTGVSAALTTSGALVFSLTGLNGAELAGQFVHIDRCTAAGTYTFSITAAGGISSPGFYRIFTEDTLLAVGGGDNGFQGTESTVFTISDGPVPTPAPTPDLCDDAWEEKFVDKNGLLQNCIWLAERIVDEGAAHCVPGLPAWTLCEETCGSCIDECPPDNDEVKFDLDGATNRNCEYIRVRLSADFGKFFPVLCDPDDNGYTYCTESCENCEGDMGGNPDGDMGGGDSTPAPQGATPGPSPDPMLTDPCDDSVKTLIFINSTIGEVPCHWLASRPDEQAIYCPPGQISNAFNVCEETCGKCSDMCEDGAGTFKDVDGVDRPCSWLSDDPVNRRPANCFPDSEAWGLCLEACGNCV